MCGLSGTPGAYTVTSCDISSLPIKGQCDLKVPANLWPQFFQMFLCEEARDSLTFSVPMLSFPHYIRIAHTVTLGRKRTQLS